MQNLQTTRYAPTKGKYLPSSGSILGSNPIIQQNPIVIQRIEAKIEVKTFHR